MMRRLLLEANGKMELMMKGMERMRREEKQMDGQNKRWDRTE